MRGNTLTFSFRRWLPEAGQRVCGNQPSLYACGISFFQAGMRPLIPDQAIPGSSPGSSAKKRHGYPGGRVFFCPVRKTTDKALPLNVWQGKKKEDSACALSSFKIDRRTELILLQELQVLLPAFLRQLQVLLQLQELLLQLQVLLLQLQVLLLQLQVLLLRLQELLQELQFLHSQRMKLSLRGRGK